MLHVKVIAVGALKESFWKEACAEYLKRITPYAKVEVQEVPDRDPKKCSGVAGVLDSEGNSILAAIPDRAFAILLDVDGKVMSSEGIAKEMERMAVESQSQIVFVIGGSFGVGEKVRKRANARWSLGKITLPHNLARVVLLEQIYRAFKIMRGEPYHK